MLGIKEIWHAWRWVFVLLREESHSDAYLQKRSLIIGSPRGVG